MNTEKTAAENTPDNAGWTLRDQVSQEAEPAIVIRAHGMFFRVQLRDDTRILIATVKGTLKRERRGTDLVAVGDRVWVKDVGAGEGQIEAVEPRQRVLARLARRTDDVEQIILANADQVLFVFAIREPEPHVRLLDRFLVLAESRGLPALIGVNKIDLDESVNGKSLAEYTFGDYRSIYPVLFLSARTHQGIDDLRRRLAGKVTAIAGPSGVGKSSLLNELHPSADQDVAELSTATGKGRHTTTGAQLYQIDQTTYIADTPGIRALALQGIAPEQLADCFPEFRPFLGLCFYQDCHHLHEPGCAVREAVAEGTISAARYDSYASLYRGDRTD